MEHCGWRFVGGANFVYEVLVGGALWVGNWWAERNEGRQLG